MGDEKRADAREKHGAFLPYLALLFLSGCSSTSRAKDPEGMVRIPAGHYHLGAGRQYPEELVKREVDSPGFSIDRTEVTNAEFKRFVDATGYVTFAERAPKKEGDPPPGSACCRAAHDLEKVTDRWTYVEGANWRHPGGKGTGIETRMKYPVVHITFEDARAFAKWCGKDLPTQDEWEIAARGGLADQPYEWGPVFNPEGGWRANTYQGKFPEKDFGKDGFSGLAPVGSFPANGYGLLDMTGNAWELTKDSAPKDGPSGQECHWAKGGSFLCAANYCARYRPAARIPITVDTSTEHVGFRCVKRIP